MKPVSLAVVLFPGLPSFSLSCSSLQHVGPALGPDVSIETSSVSKRSLNISSVRSTNAVSLCRVVGSLKYGSRLNNTLRFEVWLPEAKSYNGRYLSVGNGGFAGTIDYATMLANLNAGYAVGGCDSGHPASANGESQPGSFVPYLNDRDKTRAWIHDSIAMFTAPAKQLTTAFYRRPPKKSYYYGCSTGGAQGFALAQLHPDVFDGIYAGCPGNYYSHLILSFLWNGLNSNSPGAFLPQSALDLITSAIRSQCGAVDGVVADPAKCDFNVTSLLCMPDQNPTPTNSTTVCLTAAQVANAKKFYAGPKDVRTGTQVYPGFAFGSEIEWMHQQTTLYLAYGVPILQNLVFKNLSYDHTTFNWGSDVAEVDRTAGVLIDEISPDLRPFKARGGKMIVTQGWADPYNSPFWPIQQRAEMANIFGDELSSFFSLFMIPGGGHCGAASGYDQVPATYHVLDRLVTWVEEGQQPQDLLTTDPPDGSGRSKLLYPYE